MTALATNIIVGLVCLLAGGIIVSIICDRANRAEADRLQREIHANSVFYLNAVQTMEKEIDEKEHALQLKQRVLDSLNDEVARLRKINKKLKGE